jgi:hypothetical protein
MALSKSQDIMIDRLTGEHSVVRARISKPKTETRNPKTPNRKPEQARFERRLLLRAQVPRLKALGLVLVQGLGFSFRV